MSAPTLFLDPRAAAAAVVVPSVLDGMLAFASPAGIARPAAEVVCLTGQDDVAIAARTTVVTGLQDELGVVQNTIKAIDGRMTVGGCVA